VYTERKSGEDVGAFKNPNMEKNSTFWNSPNSDPCKSFLRTKVLYTAYHQIFDVAFASEATNFILALVYIIFLLVSPAVLPGVVTFTLFVAASCFPVAAFLLFDQVAKSHISIQKLIVANREKFRNDTCSLDYKFWSSMKPPSSSILGLCTFETKEFLLVIWAAVVMMSVINLLLAF